VPATADPEGNAGAVAAEASTAGANITAAAGAASDGDDGTAAILPSLTLPRRHTMPRKVRRRWARRQSMSDAEGGFFETPAGGLEREERVGLLSRVSSVMCAQEYQLAMCLTCLVCLAKSNMAVEACCCSNPCCSDQCLGNSMVSVLWCTAVCASLCLLALLLNATAVLSGVRAPD
jgi:hypothetical protein